MTIPNQFQNLTGKRLVRAQSVLNLQDTAPIQEVDDVQSLKDEIFTRWCVAHTQPVKEQVAKQHLLDQGYGVYLPLMRKSCRHARKVEQKLVPLFPRYIFISMNLNTARWRSINSTRGIAYLLMGNDTTPAYVANTVINDLKSQETNEGIVLATSLWSFVKGDNVRIVDGAFTDHLATFEALDDKSRVQLLLNFMGREMRVALPIYNVEAA